MTRNRRQARRYLLAGMAGLALMITSGGCTSSPGSSDEDLAKLPRDSNAKALLDTEHSRVSLPITEFRMSRQLGAKFFTATELMIRPCLAQAGYSIKVPAAVASGEDRIWGLWDSERARIYGYNIPEPPELAFKEPTSPEYEKTRTQCWKSSNADREQLLGDAPDDLKSLASSIESKAASAAKTTDEFKNLHTQYGECLKNKGYQAAPDAFIISEGSVPVSDGGDAAPEEIRAAVAEAECNQTLQVTQKMGDLEASFQAPMIEEHRAALNQEKEKLQAFERRVDEYLRTHQ